MRKIILGGGLSGLLLALFVIACGSNGFNGFGGNGFLGNIFCQPDGFFDVSGTTTLPSGALVLDNVGDAISGQSVSLDFGSAVTAANLTDGTTLDTTGDTALTDSAGIVELEVDCSEVGNNANPCSTSFTTTVDSQTSSCGATFF